MTLRPPTYGIHVADRGEGPPQAADGWFASSLAPPVYGVDMVDSDPIQAQATGRRPAGFFVPSAPPPDDVGSPLPPAVRADMEASLGADLAAVRVHEGSYVPRLGALAFTRGADVHFAPGHYEPSSPRGRELLGHELAHVVQQAERRVRVTNIASGLPLNDDPRLEQEADDVGARVARGRTTGVPGAARITTVARVGTASAPIQGFFTLGPKVAVRDEDTGDFYSITAMTGTHYVVKRDRDGFTTQIRLEGQQWVAFGETAQQTDQRLNRPPVVAPPAPPPPSVAPAPAPVRVLDDTDMTVAPAPAPRSARPPLPPSAASAASATAALPSSSMVDDEPPSSAAFQRPAMRMPAAPKKGAPNISLASNFAVQVHAAPIAKGTPMGASSSSSAAPVEMGYSAKQVWVERVLLGDMDRPDTRFGDHQERHTVAWTLLRAAHAALGGRTADEFLAYYRDQLIELQKTKQPEPTAKKIAGTLSALNDILAKGVIPIDRWQALMANAVKMYFEIYQASSAATMRHGKAVGHGEAHAMDVLRDAEAAVAAGKNIDLARAAEAATTLADVNFNKSLGDAGYASAVHHWVQALARAFPRLMAAHGAGVIAPVLDRKVSASVAKQHGVQKVGQFLGKLKLDIAASLASAKPPPATLVAGGTAAHETSVPASLAVDFIANVELDPLTAGKMGVLPVQISSTSSSSSSSSSFSSSSAAVIMVEQTLYSADQLRVRRVNVSDKDRPDTQYATQMSHTVAWTLVRHELMAMQSMSVRALMTELAKRLLARIHEVRDAHAYALAERTIGEIWAALGKSLPINEWQVRASSAVRVYGIVHQKAASTTYVDHTTHGRALGHGEAKHMERLKANERRVQENGKLADDPKQVVDAMFSLLDVQINDTLPVEAYARAIHHWELLVRSVFPLTYKIVVATVRERLAAMALPASVAGATKAKNALELLKAQADSIERPMLLFDLLRRLYRPNADKADSGALVAQLGFVHVDMPGDGNDCALAGIYHQLVTVHGLPIGNADALNAASNAQFRSFRDFVRARALLGQGRMVDVLNQGPAVLAAVQAWLDANVAAARGGGLALDIWSATVEGGLMEYRNVARHAGAGERVLTLYYNGINHFGSLRGGLARR
jgi:hypothetical protein